MKKALESIKSGKAAWPDGIPIKLLKLGEDSVVKTMHWIIVCVGATLQKRGPFSMRKLSNDIFDTCISCKQDTTEGHPRKDHTQN